MLANEAPETVPEASQDQMTLFTQNFHTVLDGLAISLVLLSVQGGHLKHGF